MTYVRAGGGGCFPMHCDSDEEVDGRRVTAICYLNPHWRAGDGGEVRCGCVSLCLPHSC